MVERKHKHLLEVARSLTFQSNTPKHFWGDCILHAAYIINRLPSPNTNLKSPFKILNNYPPDYSTMKTFGCLCYASTNQRETKFSPRATACILLGHSVSQKGYILFDTKTHKVLVSRNARFHEDIFLYHHKNLMVLNLPPKDSQDLMIPNEEDTNQETPTTLDETPNSSPTNTDWTDTEQDIEP